MISNQSVWKYSVGINFEILAFHSVHKFLLTGPGFIKQLRNYSEWNRSWKLYVGVLSVNKFWQWIHGAVKQTTRKDITFLYFHCCICQSTASLHAFKCIHSLKIFFKKFCDPLSIWQQQLMFFPNMKQLDYLSTDLWLYRLILLLTMQALQPWRRFASR